MTTRREYLAAFAALTSLSGCATTMTEEEAEEILTDGKKIGNLDGISIYRGFDEEAGVLVYASHGGYQGGVSVIYHMDTNYRP